MAGARDLVEQILIQPAGMAAAARLRRDDDAVDIDEALVALAEPQEVRAVVVGILVEGHDEGFERADAPRIERLADQEGQPLGFEP